MKDIGDELIGRYAQLAGQPENAGQREQFRLRPGHLDGFSSHAHAARQFAHAYALAAIGPIEGRNPFFYRPARRLWRALLGGDFGRLWAVVWGDGIGTHVAGVG